ncbi:hypothetical protein LR69_04310 [Geobacillus sp. BCO2]|nr:hypothetical protein LR69_04310 [Geobacillus sp. BCO2]
MRNMAADCKNLYRTDGADGTHGTDWTHGADRAYRTHRTSRTHRTHGAHRTSRTHRTHGPTGPTGPIGPQGPTGPTGPTGPAGAGAIIPFASGTTVVLTATIAGLADTASLIGFGNAASSISLVGGTINLGGTSNFSFTIPRSGSLLLSQRIFPPQRAQRF